MNTNAHHNQISARDLKRRRETYLGLIDEILLTKNLEEKVRAWLTSLKVRISKDERRQFTPEEVRGIEQTYAEYCR